MTRTDDLKARRQELNRKLNRAIINNDPNLESIRAEYLKARDEHLDDLTSGIRRIFSR